MTMTPDNPTGPNAEGYQPFLQNPETSGNAAPNSPPAGAPSLPYPPGGMYPPPPTYPGYGMPPYGAIYPYYPVPFAPSTNVFAVASLILAIAGFAGLGLVGSILGVIFGHVAQNQIKTAVPPQEGQGLASAGTIVGYIGIGFNILLWLFLLFFFFIFPIIALNSATP
jgi:hypothetical protein